MTVSTHSNVSSTAKRKVVLVTGITGQQGGHVARRLLQRGHRVRALVRKPQSPRLEEFRTQEVEFVEGDFEDSDAIGRAARGVDAMFLMGTSFEGGPEAETRQGIAAVDAARSAGVPWLVYSSVGSANQRTGIPHFDSKFAVEEYLRRSGVPFAISAPTSFMENVRAPFQLPVLRQGRFATGASRGRAIQMVALDDLSAFVTHVLESPSEFAGKRIDVASDSLNGEEEARILSEVSGRTIEYQQIPIEVLRKQNPDLAKMFEWFERGGYTADIDGLRRQYPELGWQRFREWAARQDLPRLLS